MLNKSYIVASCKPWNESGFERQKLKTQVIEPALIAKVLISSASRKVPLVHAVQKAARQMHPQASVMAGDLSADALAAYVADEFW